MGVRASRSLLYIRQAGTIAIVYSVSGDDRTPKKRFLLSAKMRTRAGEPGKSSDFTLDFFPLPSSLGLKSVTSVTSVERIRCRTSLFVKLKYG